MPDTKVTLIFTNAESATFVSIEENPATTYIQLFAGSQFFLQTLRKRLRKEAGSDQDYALSLVLCNVVDEAMSFLGHTMGLGRPQGIKEEEEELLAKLGMFPESLLKKEQS